MTDFDRLFGLLEPAKCQLEGVWNSVNIYHIVSNKLDRDRQRTVYVFPLSEILKIKSFYCRFMQLYKRAERAFLTR